MGHCLPLAANLSYHIFVPCNSQTRTSVLSWEKPVLTRLLKVMAQHGGKSSGFSQEREELVW